MIVQVNKVPCSIKAIFDTSKTVEHYVTIDEKEIHLLNQLFVPYRRRALQCLGATRQAQPCPH